MVEAEGEHESLVEPALHLRLAARDGEVVIAEPDEQRGPDQGLGLALGCARGGRIGGQPADGNARKEGGNGQRNDQCPVHGTSP